MARPGCSGFRLWKFCMPPSCKLPCPWLIVGRYPTCNLHPALMPSVQDVTGPLAASSSRLLAPGAGVQSWFKKVHLQMRLGLPTMGAMKKITYLRP